MWLRNCGTVSAAGLGSQIVAKSTLKSHGFSEVDIVSGDCFRRMWGGGFKMGLSRVALTVLLVLLVLQIETYIDCASIGHGKSSPGLKRTNAHASRESGSTATVYSESSVKTRTVPSTPTLLGDKYRPPIINFRYQGGRILWQPIHVYIVWYGTWSKSEKCVIRTAIQSLTPEKSIEKFPNLANLWKIVTKYYQDPQSPGEKRRYASKKVSIVQELDDPFSSKSIDPNNDPVNIIYDHLVAGNLKYDPDQGVYFVLTGADVAFPGGGFCGYHDFTCYNTSLDCLTTENNFLYSFVPLPSAANGLSGSCNDFGNPGGVNFIPLPPPNRKVSPSGTLDSMVDTIMHEIMELAVDPYLNAWKHVRTDPNTEAADFCNFNYAAGDWDYCFLASTYYDFSQANDPNTCSSFPNPVHYLTDPVSKVHFNQHGIDGSQFLVQKIWSLAQKGCTSQPEARCPSTQVQYCDKNAGKIQRGLFFNGVGLQTYAAGQNCSWKIKFTQCAMKVTFRFEILALGYDDLDYIKISKGDKVVKKLTGFGKNIVFTAVGKEFDLQFVTFGKRGPYPASAGFILRYTAKRHSGFY